MPASSSNGPRALRFDALAGTPAQEEFHVSINCRFGLAMAVVPELLVRVVAMVSFLGAHVVATLFGILLWRRRTVGSLTSGLFVAVVPAVLVVIALNVVGIDVLPAYFEAVMALGFASFGDELAAIRPGTD